MGTLLAPGTSYLHFACHQAKLNFLCLIAVYFGAAWILMGFRGPELCWCGAATEPTAHTHLGVGMSLTVGSLLLAVPAPPASAGPHAPSDILLGLIVFPVLFLSLSASICPVLVTMAIGEIQYHI